ncbi:hypothetical protein [Chlorogloea sp. CCALA 695]|uniref:hypothetical protein n=1 Tax=Chlorogloea sp. CCALA 695 TaxID=2107693 RepID=UPI000D07FF34|nr:hypothetical protein [Chlorogloea sp. CCALA 695]PSB30097.1 hypothetical protein C7B70_17015 [Chlorogloea sp. CCALA 695]
MSQTYKAQRQVIQIGDISLEVAMLPDGSYVFSQTEVAAVVDKSESSIRSFRRSKHLKSLPGMESQFATLTIEGVNKPIAPVSLELAALYWHKCASVGNQKAQALTIALVKYSLYDFADEAFGIKRSKQERSDNLTDDLSSTGVARLEAMYQHLSTPTSTQQSLETSSERELQLKVRLAEIELEREKLQHENAVNGFPITDLSKVGVPPWRVISQVQKSLGWSDATATYKLIRQLGYGFSSAHWFSVRIKGGVSVMSWTSIDALSEAVEQFKSFPN